MSEKVSKNAKSVVMTMPEDQESFGQYRPRKSMKWAARKAKRSRR